MQRLKEVEDAISLMQMAAADWSVLRWIAEKKKVRKAADKANEALDKLEKEVKEAWSNAWKAAYAELSAPAKSSERQHKGKAAVVDPEIAHFVKHVKEADDEAYRAHMDAEDTFAVAEKRLSTSKAREGARKAIISWDLHEKAIAKAQAGVRSNTTVS
jgi:hypothetical protein